MLRNFSGCGLATTALAALCATACAADSIDNYAFPAKTAFPASMPRYPNAVEVCPICGRTGEYAGMAGNLVERVHDPLGLELLLRGTIRGQTVRAEDWERRPVGSVGALGGKFRVSIAMFPGRTADQNTERIGVVVLEPKP